MGKIEVRGTAERTVDYDLMKITVEFQAKDETSDKVSKKVMCECEEFLARLKERGFDLSAIALASDDIQQSYNYRHDTEVRCYQASRELELVCKFNMKLINEIRSIANEMRAEVGFRVSYMLSEENAIMKELLKEALLDAKDQAELLAASINQKVKGLISADKNEPKSNKVYGGEILCMECDQVEEASYQNSDELGANSITLSEHILTVWEIE